MAKRTIKTEGDLVSEAQRNSRWFMGYRSRTFWTDLTPEEWARYLRSLKPSRPAEYIMMLVTQSLICVIVTIIFFGAFVRSGFTWRTAVFLGFTILMWAYNFMTLKRFFPKEWRK
jgi:hypothetical protein